MPGPRPGLKLVLGCARLLQEEHAAAARRRDSIPTVRGAVIDGVLRMGTYAEQAWAEAGRLAAAETIDMVLAHARHFASPFGSDSLQSSADDEGNKIPGKAGTGALHAGASAQTAVGPAAGPESGLRPLLGARSTESVHAAPGSEAGKSSASRRRKRGRRRGKRAGESSSRASLASGS